MMASPPSWPHAAAPGRFRQCTGCHRLHASLSPAFRRLASSNLAAQFSEQIALAAAPPAVLALGADAADRLSADRPDPALPAAVAARRRAGRPHAAPAADERRRVRARRQPAVPAGAALVRPADPAAAGRAGLPGRSRHRRLAWPPRAGAPAGAPARWPAPTAGWNWRAAPSRPVRPPAARWSRAGRVRRLCAGDCAVAAGRPAAGGPAGRRARRDGGTPPHRTRADRRRRLRAAPSTAAARAGHRRVLQCGLVRAAGRVRGLCHPRPGAGRRRRGPDAGDLWPGHAGRRAAGAAPGALAELRRADRRRPAVRAAGQRPDAADPGAPLARAGRARASSCSAPVPSSGPSPPPRCARRSRPTPCWAAYRPLS